MKIKPNPQQIISFQDCVFDMSSASMQFAPGSLLKIDRTSYIVIGLDESLKVPVVRRLYLFEWLWHWMKGDFKK